MAKYDIYNPSYECIHNACKNWVVNFSRFVTKFDQVVGLSRGGLIPGVIVSHMLEVPFTPISYSSAAGAGDNKDHTNVWSLPDVEGTTILVVDDICDTGLTLKDVVDHYKNKGKVVYTAVLHYKVRENGPHVPDFYWQKIPVDSPWVIYPFERTEKL
jgi:hypoxanthine phosphoribosyltransferase